MKANGVECQIPYTINIIQVKTGEALSERSLSLNILCSVDPIIPSASIIQNKINDPIKGVTIIGNKEKKIVGPFKRLARELVPKAIKKPKIITNVCDHKGIGNRKTPMPCKKEDS